MTYVSIPCANEPNRAEFLERFVSDHSGVGTGRAVDAASVVVADPKPFDQIRYWDFFPGTD